MNMTGLDIEVPRWAVKALMIGIAVFGSGVQAGAWLAGHDKIIAQLHAQQLQIDTNQKILTDHLTWADDRSAFLTRLDRKVTILAKLKCLEVDQTISPQDRRLAEIMCNEIVGNQIPGQ